MTGTRACPQCGDAIAADSPEGLCPRCLLQSGFAEGAASTPPSGVTTPYPGTFVAPSPADLARHFPQMEILELLGQGGMGAVYKARQPKLDRLVAVKILPPEWDKDPAFAERFAREAKAMARLTHPHIVAVHDFGETDGLFYLVMEYVDGANLRHILHENHLQPAEALAIIPQVCDALQYAHEEGIVHRDIKPENILLDSKGRVKIADFGLAKLLNRQRAAFTLTGSHQVMGTLDYMAPEQRLRPQEVDHRADIYSLGVVFYEMLTGELPLGRFDPPSHKAKIDARLDEVVFRALEREPARRYQRASQVKVDVESISTGRRPARHAEPAAEAAVAPHAGIDQFALAGPAAGLFLTGLLGMLFWTILGLAVYATADPWMRSGERTVFLLMPLLGFPAGIALIVGSRKMAHARDYYWSVGASIWAMMPWSPAWLIGLPAGIFALLVLRRPDMHRLFGVAIRQRHQVIPPAIALLLAGITGGLFWMVTGIVMMALGRRPYGQSPEIVIGWLMILGGAVAGFMLIHGATKMMRLRSYQASVLSAWWACMPWSPAWVIALPFGIWALRVLNRREIQLAFGLPFQPHDRAFERPIAAIPVARPTPQPPQPTGPVRRGVRNFFGSMYSLMFHSRMEHPSQPAFHSSVQTQPPGDVEDPAAIESGAPNPVSSWPGPTEPKRRIWPWVVGTVGIFLFVSLILLIARSFDSQRSPATAFPANGGSRPTMRGLSILEDRYRDFKTKYPLIWFEKDVEEIFRRTEQEYLALEARFTKRERSGGNRVTVTIKPFTTELQELDKRFQSNLQAVLLRDMQQQGRSFKMDSSARFVDQSAFPFGENGARIEIWRDHNGWYQGRVSRGIDAAKGELVEEFSGPQLPRMYERFWAN